MNLANELIESVEIYRVENPSLKPTVVRIRTTSGIVGLGDTGLSYGAGTEAMPYMVAEFFRKYVLGRSLADQNTILLDLNYDTFWAKRPGAFFGGAISAVDQALHDARARALGIPLHELLGGKIHEQMPAYANGWYSGKRGEQEYVAAARQVVNDGHTGMKFYPIAEETKNTVLRHPNPAQFRMNIVQTAIENVRQLREIVGGDMKLMVDLSAVLPRDRVSEYLNAMRDLDIAFVEEVFDAADETSLKWISSTSPVPIAGGERLIGLAAFESVLSTNGISILQPDISLMGGHKVFQAVAAVAQARSVRVSPHNCTSGIGTAHTVHAASSIPNLYSVETYCYQHTAEGYQEILVNPYERNIKNGLIQALDEPGIGVDLDDAVADKFLVDRLVAG